MALPSTTVLDLHDDALSRVMQWLRLPDRVVLASSHPRFRQLLYAPGQHARSLWSAHLVLALHNSHHDGGGWSHAAGPKECNRCTASVEADPEAARCGDCKLAYFCPECPEGRRREHHHGFCQQFVRGTSGHQGTDTLCRVRGALGAYCRALL